MDPVPERSLGIGGGGGAGVAVAVTMGGKVTCADNSFCNGAFFGVALWKALSEQEPAKLTKMMPIRIRPHKFINFELQFDMYACRNFD